MAKKDKNKSSDNTDDRIKYVSNTTARPIYGNYKDGNSVNRVLFNPGLTQVSKKELKLLLKGSAFSRYVDNNILSVNKADLELARDVSETAEANNGQSKEVAKPVRPPNSKRNDLEMSNSAEGAVSKAKAKT